AGTTGRHAADLRRYFKSAETSWLRSENEIRRRITEVCGLVFEIAQCEVNASVRSARLFYRRSGEIGNDPARGVARQSPGAPRSASGDRVFPDGSKEIRQCQSPDTIRLSDERIVFPRAIRGRTEMARARIQRLSAAKISRNIRSGCV